MRLSPEMIFIFILVLKMTRKGHSHNVLTHFGLFLIVFTALLAIFQLLVLRILLLLMYLDI